jgi:nucleoside-diphosphate-sugar epimerase
LDGIKQKTFSMTDFPRHIVVTGGNGFVGKAVAQLARRCGARVISCDLKPGPKVERADICDLERMIWLFEGADCIIHCAGLHAPHVGVVTESHFRKTNVEGTATVVRAMQRANVKSLVFTSTTALLGGGSAPGETARWIDETSVPKARSIYHETKIAAEAIIKMEVGPALSASILRLGRCFTESADLMALYRLSRGIDVRDAAMAHLRATTTATPTPTPMIVSAITPFHREDCAALGTAADQVIRLRCPALANQFEQLGWPLPSFIDRVYDSRYMKEQWNWSPQFGAMTVVRRAQSRSAGPQNCANDRNGKSG